MASQELVTVIALGLNAVSTTAIAVTALLLRQQIQTAHDWNRRKASQEALKDLVFGELPAMRARLEFDLGCRVWDHECSFKKTVQHLEKGTFPCTVWP